MKVRVMGQVYEGEPVCQDCGEKHYPDPAAHKWLTVEDSMRPGRFYSVPVMALCIHCGGLKVCAFKMLKENDGIITVTE